MLYPPQMSQFDDFIKNDCAYDLSSFLSLPFILPIFYEEDHVFSGVNNGSILTGVPNIAKKWFCMFFDRRDEKVKILGYTAVNKNLVQLSTLLNSCAIVETGEDVRKLYGKTPDPFFREQLAAFGQLIGDRNIRKFFKQMMPLIRNICLQSPNTRHNAKTDNYIYSASSVYIADGPIKTEKNILGKGFNVFLYDTYDMFGWEDVNFYLVIKKSYDTVKGFNKLKYWWNCIKEFSFNRIDILKQLFSSTIIYSIIVQQKDVSIPRKYKEIRSGSEIKAIIAQAQLEANERHENIIKEAKDAMATIHLLDYDSSDPNGMKNDKADGKFKSAFDSLLDSEKINIGYSDIADEGYLKLFDNVSVENMKDDEIQNCLDIVQLRISSIKKWIANKKLNNPNEELSDIFNVNLNKFELRAIQLLNEKDKRAMELCAYSMVDDYINVENIKKCDENISDSILNVYKNVSVESLSDPEIHQCMRFIDNKILKIETDRETSMSMHFNEREINEYNKELSILRGMQEICVREMNRRSPVSEVKDNVDYQKKIYEKFPDPESIKYYKDKALIDKFFDGALGKIEASPLKVSELPETVVSSVEIVEKPKKARKPRNKKK
jgi:hypothetical protein